MKIFKLINFAIISTLLVLISCKPEPAPPSTEKEIIEEISRDWSATAEGDDFANPISFTAKIYADSSDETKIFVQSFHNMGSDRIYAKVFTDLSLEIPRQEVGNQFFKGTGEISNDLTQITWTYTIEFEDDVLNNRATFTYGVTS